MGIEKKLKITLEPQRVMIMLSGKGNEMLNLTDMPRCAKANDSG